MTPVRVLPKESYQRDPEIVAKELLGKKLIRKLDGNFLEGIIVETEAYYGLNDPASRAYDGIKDYNKLMWKEPGKAFIYNVHKYWMFNIVAHKPNQIGAVLIRAIEPTKGIGVMKDESFKKITTEPSCVAEEKSCACIEIDFIFVYMVSLQLACTILLSLEIH